jgi:hypothetical protein
MQAAPAATSPPRVEGPPALEQIRWQELFSLLSLPVNTKRLLLKHIPRHKRQILNSIKLVFRLLVPSTAVKHRITRLLLHYIYLVNPQHPVYVLSLSYVNVIEDSGRQES